MDFNWLRTRKRELGITDDQIADAIGKERSVANKLVNGKLAFDLKYVDGLSRALQVDRSEILRRAGALGDETITNANDDLPSLVSNAKPIPMEAYSGERPRYDLPVYGSGLGAAREIEGEAIEQTTLNSGETVDRVKRPSILADKEKAYALHVQGGSMHPALPDGDIVIAVPEMPLGIGDNVVVYLRPENPEDDDGDRARAVLVKELVRRSATFIELRQYQPPMDFRIPRADVLRIDRILTRKEMIS